MPRIENYASYMNSGVWRRKRLAALALVNYKCKKCGFRALKGQHVHHLTYVRFGGDERLGDLQVLCEHCHMTHHERVKEVAWLWAGKRFSVRKRHFFEVYDRQRRVVLGSLQTFEQALEFAKGADSTVEEEVPTGADKLIVVKRKRTRRGPRKPRAKRNKGKGISVGEQRKQVTSHKGQRNRRRSGREWAKNTPISPENAAWLKQVQESRKSIDP